MFYSAAAVRTEWSGRLHFLSLSAGQQKATVQASFWAKKHPPTRSVGEWGAHSLIGLVSPQNLWVLRGPRIKLKWAGEARPFQGFALRTKRLYAALAANMDSLLCVRGKKTSPHSLRRRMGGSLIDRTVHWSVPLTFTDCRSDTNLLGESGKLWELPILKTALHADICSGIYQNVLVWLIIVSVFRLWGCFQKLLAVDTYSIPNGFFFRSCEPPSFLAHGTHSFPVSTIYNSISVLSIAFMKII